MKPYINCARCDKYTNKHHKGYCDSCYNYTRLQYKRDISPLKKCECNIECKTMIPILTMRNKPNKYAKGHIKRNTNQRYIKFHKPYYKYSGKNGIVLAHRYIMYLYLSILNNKVIYIPKGFDVHHKNGNGRDNTIQNLELVSRKQHMTIHNLFSGINGKNNKINMSDRFCNICYISENETRNWIIDIIGYICHSCYRMVRYYKYKFNMDVR